LPRESMMYLFSKCRSIASQSNPFQTSEGKTVQNFKSLLHPRT
jgi:hypothetical protein